MNHSTWRRLGIGGGHGRVQGRCAVRGDLQVVRLRERGAAQPAGVAAAAGGVELQAVHHRAAGRATS